MALAIELAAARLPALGLDGLVAGLSDHLRLLVGGHRADERHRSVRAMLDWSQALLSRPDLTLLRRVSILVSPFTAPAAARVAGFRPWNRARSSTGWPDSRTRACCCRRVGGRHWYRALETIRQYGTEQLTETGELAATRAHHLRCLATATELAQDPSRATGGWRARFDAVADEFRAALGWAAEQPEYRIEARPGPVPCGPGLRATSRVRPSSGTSRRPASPTTRLPRLPPSGPRRTWPRAGCAATTPTASGRPPRRRPARRRHRGRGPGSGHGNHDLLPDVGVFAQLPSPDEAAALLTARELAGDDPAGQAAVVLAECAALGYAFFAEQAEPKTAAAKTTALAEQAVELARRLDDPLAESAALYALTGAQHRAGDTFAAAATARRRVDLLHSVPVTPGTAFELIDALLMATATSIGVGALPAARQWGRQLRDLPLLAEVGHVATSRLLVADALAGHATDVILASRRFLDAWTQAGHPKAPSFGPAAAVAMIHGLRDDETARDEWLAIIDQLGVTPERRSGYSPAFDAIALLHHGDAALALERLGTQPHEPNKRPIGIWPHWHLALRAEAAVLAGHPDANHLLRPTDRRREPHRHRDPRPCRRAPRRRPRAPA